MSDLIRHSFAIGDLSQSREFLNELRNTPNEPETKTVRKALTLASVASYFRGFKLSYVENRKTNWIDKSIVEKLPEHLKELHKRLEDERDKAWIHTDWQQHEPKSFESNSGSTVISRNPWIPFDTETTELFLELICNVEKLEYESYKSE